MVSTERVMEAVIEHIHALRKILESAKKQVCKVPSLRHGLMILKIETQLFIHDEKRSRKVGRHWKRLGFYDHANIIDAILMYVSIKSVY
jgi:hypothetical protein